MCDSPCRHTSPLVRSRVALTAPRPHHDTTTPRPSRTPSRVSWRDACQVFFTLAAHPPSHYASRAPRRWNIAPIAD